jgi:hypothetical protein
LAFPMATERPKFSLIPDSERPWHYVLLSLSKESKPLLLAKLSFIPAFASPAGVPPK